MNFDVLDACNADKKRNDRFNTRMEVLGEYVIYFLLGAICAGIGMLILRGLLALFISLFIR